MVEVSTPEQRPPTSPLPTIVIPPSVAQGDPATCPIVPAVETTIEIQKGKTGLGLSIIGGSDTLLVCTATLINLTISLSSHVVALRKVVETLCSYVL